MRLQPINLQDLDHIVSQLEIREKYDGSLTLDQISIVNEIKKYILLKTQNLENATYFIKNELEKEG